MKHVRSVKVAVLDRNGDMLVLRRSGTHPRAPFEDDIPGGVLEAHESVEEGASRELKEETGLDVAPGDLKFVYEFEQQLPDVFVRRLLYAARLDAEKPDITMSYEHDQFSWQPVDQVSGMESPYQKGIDYANENDKWKEV